MATVAQSAVVLIYLTFKGITTLKSGLGVDQGHSKCYHTVWRPISEPHRDRNQHSSAVYWRQSHWRV